MAGALLAITMAGFVARRPGWAIIAGVFTIGYALSPSLGWALLFCALVGPAVSLRDVAQDSLLQATVNDEFMGRVQSMRTMGSQWVFMIGGATCAWLADQIDVRWIYAAGGGLYVLSGLYAFSRRAIRHSKIDS